MIIPVLNYTKNQVGAGFSAALGTAIVCGCNCKVLLAENCFGKDCLGDVLIDSRYSIVLKRETSYCAGHNCEESLARWVERSFNKPAVGDYVSIIDESLFYAPFYNGISQLSYELNLDDEIQKIIDNYHDLAEILIVNTDNSTNITSRHIIDSSDKIIVIVENNNESVADVIDQLSKLEGGRDKCIFVALTKKPVEDKSLHYNELKDMNSQLSKGGIRREQFFNFYISDDFFYFMELASVTDYIQSNYRCARNSSEYYTIKQIKDIADCIMSSYARANGFSEAFGTKWYSTRIDYSVFPKTSRNRRKNDE